MPQKAAFDNKGYNRWWVCLVIHGQKKRPLSVRPRLEDLPISRSHGRPLKQFPPAVETPLLNNMYPLRLSTRRSQRLPAHRGGPAAPFWTRSNSGPTGPTSSTVHLLHPYRSRPARTPGRIRPHIHDGFRLLPRRQTCLSPRSRVNSC